jgi:murein DD-endopeptidase MepM/ murein hydrolase activator NlpD
MFSAWFASLLLPLALLAPAQATGPPLAPTGRWVAPVAGRLVVLRAFDPPPPGRPRAAGHRGVDLAAPVGSPVRSAGAGRVAYAGPVAGRGVVVVDHGGLRTTYQPVVPAVRVGERVVAGALLGRLGAPGPCWAPWCLGRPHLGLHWGLLRGRVYLDPLLLLGLRPDGSARVRLLPFLGAPARGP